MIDKDDIDEIIEHLLADEPTEPAEIPETVLPLTSRCVSPVRVVDGLQSGFTSAELAHIPECVWCQRTISNRFRVECPARWRVLRAVLAPAQEPLADAILRHAESHSCLPCGTLATGAASFIDRAREAVACVFEERVLAPQGTGFQSGQDDYEPVELAKMGPVSVVMKRQGSRLYLTARVDPPDPSVKWVEVLIHTSRGLEPHRIDVETRYGVQQGTAPLGESETWLQNAGNVELGIYYGKSHA